MSEATRAIGHTTTDFSHIPSLANTVPEQRYRGYAITVLLVSLATVICWYGRRFLLLTDDTIIFLYVIVVTALRFSLGPAVVASVLSVLAYDFFCVPPVLEFNIDDIRYTVTFAMMAAVGLLVTKLTSRIRRERNISIDRGRRTAALFALSRDLGSATDEIHVAGLLVRHTAKAFGTSAAVLMPDSAGTPGTLQFIAKEGTIAYRSEEQLAVTWVYEHGATAGDGTDVHSDARITCVPIPSAATTLGVLAVEYLQNAPFSAELLQILESFG